jgi:ABC-type dipeptide/oligopeptide/nickel transport system permease subunit
MAQGPYAPVIQPGLQVGLRSNRRRLRLQSPVARRRVADLQGIGWKRTYAGFDKLQPAYVRKAVQQCLHHKLSANSCPSTATFCAGWSLLVPLLIGVTLLAFVISNAVPADPVTANLGQKAMSDPKIVAAFRAEWGLDRPVAEQYVVYLQQSPGTGDLGRSIKSRRAVAEDLAAYLPATIELATTAILIGVAVGMALGLVSALRRNSWLDHSAHASSASLA